MTEQQAKTFAEQWIHSWNSGDLDAILEHYGDEIEFYSPMIALLKFNDKGLIRDKKELKAYFQLGLNAYPDLNFKLHNVFAGVNTLVLYYTSVKGRMAAEVFEINDQGKAKRVYCNYSMNHSNY